MKKLTISYMLEGARLAMAIGVGAFVRGICKDYTRDKSRIKATGYWMCGLATAWAIGHSVDSYIDRASVILGVTNPDGSPSKEFIEECCEL